MRLRLSVSEAASIDLEQMREWLTQSGAGGRAATRLKSILDALERLAEAPHLWPAGDVPGTQECKLGGYVVVYRANCAGPGRTGATEVEVLRVFGPGQLRQL